MKTINAALQLMNTKLNLKAHELALMEMLLEAGVEWSVPISQVYQCLGPAVVDQIDEKRKFERARHRLDALFMKPLVIRNPNSTTSFPFFHSFEMKPGSTGYLKYRVSQSFIEELLGMAGPVEGLLDAYCSPTKTVH
jgi:hypothetical protein